MIKLADYPAKWRCVLLGLPNSGGASGLGEGRSEGFWVV